VERLEDARHGNIAGELVGSDCFPIHYRKLNSESLVPFQEAKCLRTSFEGPEKSGRDRVDGRRDTRSTTGGNCDLDVRSIHRYLHPRRLSEGGRRLAFAREHRQEKNERRRESHERHAAVRHDPK